MAEDIFMALRKNIREYGKSVIDHVIRNHFSPGDFAGKQIFVHSVELKIYSQKNMYYQNGVLKTTLKELS